MNESPVEPGTQTVGQGRALIVMPTYNEAGNLATIVPASIVSVAPGST